MSIICGAVQAEKTAALFTRDQDVSGVAALYDMQHLWYECHAGAAHLRRKEYGKALKKYTMILKHFEDMQEDQFDFHGYCVRKTTLRAYVAMLRWEDVLQGQDKAYLLAAAGAIRAYLALADRPTAAQQVRWIGEIIICNRDRSGIHAMISHVEGFFLVCSCSH